MSHREQMHRGARVSVRPYSEPEFWFFAHTEPTYAREHRTRSARGAACLDALAQYGGRSSYRNRRQKAGPIVRFGGRKS